MKDYLTLEILRAIGQRLSDYLKKGRLSIEEIKPLSRGAAGDRTFQMDQTAEEIIINSLRRVSIPLTVVSEEIGIVHINGGGHRVLIDPVDGSKNAVTGIPIFCTSIAVTDTDDVSGIYLSYIINPLTGDEYWAEEGRGAFFNGIRMQTQKDEEVRVVLYETQDPKRDFPKILPVLSLSNRTRCFGTTALDLAFLSMGAASVYINPSQTRSFDYAAGVHMVKESGGIVTTIDGHDISRVELSMKRTDPLLACANTRILERVLRELENERIV
jgi:myo-inositol-1(or 4)-monophosphatase